MLIFHLQSGIWEFHFPFTCNLYGKCFGIIGNALDFQPRDPWFESGRLQQFFSSIFFSFWPFTLPSPLLIKTCRIANNVINNHIYFIITLLSLDHHHHHHHQHYHHHHYDHDHDHHDDHHCLHVHVYITSPFLYIVNIQIYKIEDRPPYSSKWRIKI